MRIELEGCTTIDDEAGVPILDEAGGYIIADGLWQDVTSDMISGSARMSRGFGGISPNDRVAKTGKLSLKLNNDWSNSGGVVGYYSKDHASRRPGWGHSCYLRLIMVDSAVDYYRFYGKVVEIEPEPGLFRGLTVSVSAQDYMGELVSRNTELLPVQELVTGVEVVSALLDAMPKMPLGRSVLGGYDIMPYALHTSADEKSSVMSVLQNVCQSDMSYVFVTGDLTGGETFNLETRHSANWRSSIITLDNTMAEIKMRSSDETVKNKVSVTGYPPTVDTSPVVVAKIGQEIALGPGQSVTKTLRFTDPDNGGRLKGVKDPLDPVAGTDYKFSFTRGGSDTGGNASVLLSDINFGANSMTLTVTNGHTTKSVFSSLFQVRGYGIYLYDKVETILQDDDSIAAYGERPLTYAVPYLYSAEFTNGLAGQILTDYADPFSNVESAKFEANKSAALMTAAVTGDIHQKVTLVEAVSGISQGFLIAGLEYAITGPQELECTWLLDKDRSNANMGRWGTNAGDSGVWGTDASDSTEWVF